MGITCTTLKRKLVLVVLEQFWELVGRVGLTAITIFLGSITHALAKWNEVRNGIGAKEDSQFTAVDFIILFSMSVFVGIMFALSVGLFTDNNVAWAVSGGIGSFLNLAGMYWLSKLWQSFVESKTPKGGEGRNG